MNGCCSPFVFSLPRFNVCNSCIGVPFMVGVWIFECVCVIIGTLAWCVWRYFLVEGGGD